MGSTASGRLANTAIASSSRSAGCRLTATPVRSTAAAHATSRSSHATDMRLRVSVPVLSVQSTVAAPRVSIAAGRRVNTWERDSRHAPITMNTVRTSGNSSGSIDIASAMPPSRPCSHAPRRRP
jgi:hypothetical protein